MINRQSCKAEQSGGFATQLAYAQLGDYYKPRTGGGGYAHAGVIRATGLCSAGIIAAQTIADLKKATPSADR